MSTTPIRADESPRASEELIEALGRSLRPIFEKYGVLKAYIFGSIARKDVSRRSDVDLLLVQDTEKRYLDRLDGILAETMDVVEDRNVDLIIYTPSELETMSDTPFIRSVMEESVVIYEPGQE
jgi:predicted nucleotidyltransferase